MQPLFPGKVIFVHRRNFCSIPDYVPSWRNQDNPVPVQEALLTDDIEVVSGPVTVKNPRWEHKDESKKESSPDMASFGDTIILMADVTGMPEKSGITFDIYETSATPPMWVDSAKGKIEKGVGKGEWVVTDKSGNGAKSKLVFEGIAKSKASERCEIKVTPSVVWAICCAPDDSVFPDAQYSIYADGAKKHSGKTNAAGEITAPFERLDGMELVF